MYKTCAVSFFYVKQNCAIIQCSFNDAYQYDRISSDLIFYIKFLKKNHSKYSFIQLLQDRAQAKKLRSRSLYPAVMHKAFYLKRTKMFRNKEIQALF